MNWIKRNANITLLAVSLAASLLFVEFVLLEVFFNKRDAAARVDIPFEDSGIDFASPTYQAENVAIYELTPHPWRWYMLKESPNHSIFNINRLGYRIDEASATAANGPVVGMFGGSTTFSVLTAAEYSIPSHIEDYCGRPLTVLNFGVGGYSSSAQLGAYLEAVRHFKLDHALFYDGVNEVGRYIEAFQVHGDTPHIYRQVGFPYDIIDFVNLPYRQYQPEFLLFARQTNIGRAAWKLLNVALYGGNTAHNDQAILNDTPRHAGYIANTYLRNIAALEALTALENTPAQMDFFWQPMLAFKLTKHPQEEGLEHPVESALHQQVRAQVTASAKVIDLSQIFAAEPGRIYYDSVHVGKAGNARIAQAIVQQSPYLSAYCSGQN